MYNKYITTGSFLRKQYIITYKSITLLIKRRNSQVKQSESIFETNMGNVFCILWNFIVHLRQMIYSLFYKLTHVRRICKRYFTVIKHVRELSWMSHTLMRFWFLLIFLFFFFIFIYFYRNLVYSKTGYNEPMQGWYLDICE